MAEAVLEPLALPSVKVVEVWPLAEVVELAAPSVPPPSVTLQSMVRPETGFRLASFAMTVRGRLNCVATPLVCVLPDTTARVVGAPAEIVKALVVTELTPSVPLAVKV